jgi:regulation of enolase protein 1 (concanavalin A-like superfamily)
MVTAPRLVRVWYFSVLVVLFAVLLAGFPFSHRHTIAAQQTWSLPAPWSAQDVGGPAIGGSASFDQGTFSINASGSDIWGKSDQFTFVYQQITGDVEIVARVDSVTAANSWSKSGVMIRSSLAANAAHGYALVSAGRGVAFQQRSTNGGSSSNTTGPGAAAPYWVRLVRKGTTVTAYSSATGTTWSTIASRTIGLGSTAYVGIATTSHNNSATTTAAVSQVSIVPLSLPAPQQAADIGAPAPAGSTTYGQGVYRVHAGGADIWGTSDQFHFVYQPMTGDGEVVAHVQSITNSDVWAKTGVMIRETLAADSRHAFALVTAGSGYAFQRRIDPAGVSLHSGGPSGTAPGWVRLVRTASRFEAFQSVNGSTWTSMGSDTIPMADTVYVGMATTSHNMTTATDAVLDSFKVTASGSTSNQPPNVAITSPADGSIFTAGNNIVVNAGANDTDGTIARVDFFAGTTPLGSATASPYSATWPNVPAGTYSLTAVAVDNDGASTTSASVSVRVDPAANQPPAVTLTAPANGASYTAPATISLAANASDTNGTVTKVEFYSGTTLLSTDTTAPYAFTWSAVPSGTYGLRAVAYDNGGATASSATSTVTVSATANQPPAVTLTAPTNGATYTAPATVALTATASDPDGTIARVEFYSGTTLLGTDTTSPYSYSWSGVGAGSYSVSAKAYDNAGASATSTTSTITVTAASGLPSPWTAADIGSPALSGSTTYSNGVFSVDAAGSDIWDTADQFQFVYQPVSGDVDIAARVDSLTAVDPYTNAGVMIRATLQAGSLHAYTTLTGSNGVYFRRRVTSDGTTTGIQVAGVTAPTWVRLVRQGTLVTSYWSTDGTSWSVIGTQTLALGTTAYVGLAVSSHNSATRTTARFSNVRVGSPAANQPPTVTLTSPANGSTFTAPASVTLSATAADSDGTISKVEFYNGTTLLNSDTTSPYSYTWSSVAAGTYTVKAIAYDNTGVSTSSATSTITVNTSTTTPPTGVAFTASPDHATLVTSYELRIYASGADPNTATPIAKSNLGKPTPDASNTITVDQSVFFSGLAPANYVAAVAAIGSGGSSISTGVTFTR